MDAVLLNIHGGMDKLEYRFDVEVPTKFLNLMSNNKDLNYLITIKFLKSIVCFTILNSSII